jgi:hypothetical protein
VRLSPARTAAISSPSVAEIAARHPAISIGVLFAGAARVQGKQRGRPLTLTGQRGADAAILLGASDVIPAHYRGWSHYSETPETLAAAFEDAGVGDLCDQRTRHLGGSSQRLNGRGPSRLPWLS